VQFTYNGFTQEGNNRCYSFGSRGETNTTTSYCLWVDLSLFAKYRVPLQSGPGFCLQLLHGAFEDGAEQMHNHRNYHTIDADFTSLLAERAVQAATVASRKPRAR
jgi:hypothetical protein